MAVSNEVCEHRTENLREEMQLTRQITNANALILGRLDKSVNGNGKKGLIEQYSENKWRTWVAILLIGSGGAGSGVAFFKLLKGVIL